MQTILVISSVVGLSCLASGGSSWSAMSPGHIRRKRSFEEETYNSIAKPSFEEISDWGNYAKTQYEDKWRNQICTDDDHNCIDE